MAGGSNLSALELANQANKGALDGEAAAGAGAEVTDAAGNDAAASVDPNAADPAADAMAGAMAAAAGAPGGGLSKMSGSFGGSGGGSGSSASMGVGGAKGGSDGSQARAAAVGGSRMPGGVRGKMAASTRGRSLGNTSTLRRLSNMQKAMSGARGGGAEQSYGVHDGQWSNAEAPSGVAGAGAGIPQDGVGQKPVPSGEGAGTGNPFNDTKYFPSENTDLIVPDIPEEKNATPYQKLVDYAVVLLAISAAATALSAIVWLLAKIPHMAWLMPFAMLLTKIAGIAALGAGALGVAIAAYGQYLQGAIFAGTGFLAGILALKATGGDPTASFGKQLLKQVGLRVASGATAALGAGLGKVADSGTEFGKELIDAAAKKGEELVGGANKTASDLGKWEVDAAKKTGATVADAAKKTGETIGESIDKVQDWINPPKSSGGGAGGGGGGAF
jgi:hypothetical protein